MDKVKEILRALNTICKSNENCRLCPLDNICPGRTEEIEIGDLPEWEELHDMEVYSQING